MGDPRYSKCRVCGRSSEDVGELSWTRQCPECGARNLAENALGLHYRRGPAWQRWRNAMAACVGGVILDDAPARGHTQADSSR